MSKTKPIAFNGDVRLAKECYYAKNRCDNAPYIGEIPVFKKFT